MRFMRLKKFENGVIHERKIVETEAYSVDTRINIIRGIITLVVIKTRKSK